MSIRSDLRSISQEFSSILAGFKLALIVISYFGLGSVAKWFISHWYPFTRWVWDVLCNYFTLPIFPDVVKDSLTALVFFLPLGITAFIEFSRRDINQNKNTHRFFGAFFGLFFVVLICKDALSVIASAVLENAASGFIFNFLTRLNDLLINLPSWYYVVTFVVYTIFAASIYFSTRKNRNFYSLLMKSIRRSNFTVLILISIGLILTIGASFFSVESAILFAVSIMLIILLILFAAVAFAPRKLFVAAGAGIAFIVAALLFEFAVWLIAFIETAPS